MDTASHDHGQLSWVHTWLTSDPDVAQVPVATLSPGNSPRLNGESKARANMLAEAGEMPPIIVHRPTMTVIDGRHRLTAASLRGQDLIAVRYFDGTAEEAFFSDLSLLTYPASSLIPGNARNRFYHSHLGEQHGYIGTDHWSGAGAYGRIITQAERHRACD